MEAAIDSASGQKERSSGAVGVEKFGVEKLFVVGFA